MLAFPASHANYYAPENKHDYRCISNKKFSDFAVYHLLGKVTHGHRNQFYCKLGGSSHLVSSTEPWLVVVPPSKGTSPAHVLVYPLNKPLTNLTTLPDTNSSHLKMDGWNISFLLGWPIFRCYVSVYKSKGPSPKELERIHCFSVDKKPPGQTCQPPFQQKCVSPWKHPPFDPKVFLKM